ncbi:MAG: T9SS type A sorting domain-containing protein, partial [Bacteroidota bacterium]
TNCDESGGSIQFTVSGGSPPYQYYWRKQGASSSQWQSSAFIPNPNYTASNIDKDTYEVFVTDITLCTYASVVIVDFAANLLDIQQISGVLPDCNSSNGSITVSTVNATPPLTFELTDQAQVNQSVSSNNSTYTFTNLATATYNITVMDADGCEETQAYTLKNNTDLTVSADLSDALCADNGTINLNISGGDSPYQVDWGHLSGNDNPKDIDQLAAGTYNYTITDAVGCQLIGSEEVMYKDPLGASFTSQNADCTGENGSINFSAFNGKSPYIYYWKKTSDATYQESGLVGNSTYTATGLSAGSYNVKISDDNGCERTKSIDIGSAAGPSISYSSVNHDCNNGGGTITTTVSGNNTPFTYTWKTNTGVLVQQGADKDLSVSNIAENTAYRVTVTDSDGCTDAPADGRTLYKKLSADPRCETASGNGVYVVRSGKDGGSSQVSFLWTLDGNTYPSTEGFFNTNAGETGRYDVTITDNATGCTDSDYVIVPDQCFANNNSIPSYSDAVSPVFAVRIYPNPFQDQLTLQIIAAQAESVEVKLLDLMGRLLYAQTHDLDLGSNKIQMDWKGMIASSSIYQVLIIRADGSSEVRKVMREE